MKSLTFAVILAVIVWSAPSAEAQAPTGTTGSRSVTSAIADLVDAQGRSVGQAHLQQAPHGVLLKLELRNATPGVHGLHVHAVGQCDRPSFQSAGGHFNPTSRQHGFLNPRGPHAGDLPNIEVPSTTNHSVEYFVADLTLEPGPRSLMDADGSSIVIHAGKDDYATDPAGEAGDRLACGRVVPAGAR